MKKILFHLFLLASLFMAACHDDNGGPSSIVIYKDTTKNWEREKNGEGTLKQSTLANLTNISAKPLNAIKKPFEARVTLLSRYSFLRKSILPRMAKKWVGIHWITAIWNTKIGIIPVPEEWKTEKRRYTDAIAPICCDLLTALRFYID